ncbi:MAG: protein disulfide isomerase family protein [Nanoarchaeota archaeon]
MVNKNNSWFGLSILIIFFVFLAGCSQDNNLPDDSVNSKSVSATDALAQCLTGKGVIMYGTDWCSHCQNQKKLFGSSFQYIDFIDCDQAKSGCDEADIKGYPTWKINNQNYPGEQSIETLARLSGCSYAE